MKKFALLFLLCLPMLVFCRKNSAENSTDLVAPGGVLLPRNAYQPDLATGQSVIFEWEYSMGGNVRYQLVFDREGGDFSNPVYAQLSDNGGILPKATVTPAALKSVATIAGCKQGQSITVIWTVRTFKGTEFITGVQEGEPRTLTIFLPVEIDIPPTSLIMAGTAVEGGSRSLEHELPVSDDPDAVIETRSSWSFASYINLSAGKLTLTDNYERKFALKGDGTVEVLSADAGEADAPVSGLAYLSVDFQKLTWKSKRVTNIWFWTWPWGKGLTQKSMTYAGNGVWTLSYSPFSISWDDNGTTRYDSRHYFRIDYSDGSCDRAAYHKKDCNAADWGSDGYSTVCRYRDFQNGDGAGAAWFYAWKTRGDREGDGMTANVSLSLTGETYSYSISFVRGAYTGPKAVFMGDSISDFWDESGNGHPDFFTDNNYVSKGISGQTTAQMLARFQSDVIDLDPGCVAILAGTNDIAGNDNDGVSRSNEYILGNIRAMAEMAENAHIPVIICSLVPANVYNWNPNVHPADIIVELNGMLRQMAAEKGYAYVDYWSALADDQKGLPALYSNDGVHPVQAGYTIMERLIKPAIEGVL